MNGPGTRAVTAHYGRAAAGYSTRRDRGLAGLLRQREQAAVLELSQAGPNQRTLDVGCGDGAVASRLMARGGHVVAVDLTPAMALMAHRRGVPAVMADMQALPFRARFETIVCVGSSEFVPCLDVAAAEMAASLLPGGELVLLVPRRNWLGCALWIFHRFNGVRIFVRSRRAVARALAAVGFESTFVWRRCAAAWVCQARLGQPLGGGGA